MKVVRVTGGTLDIPLVTGPPASAGQAVKGWDSQDFRVGSGTGTQRSGRTAQRQADRQTKGQTER